MQKAVKHAREGKGPSIVECKTYRHHGHNGSDPGTYRPPEEVEAWKARDPLILFRDKGYLSFGVAAEICAAIQDEVFYDLDAPIQRLCAPDVSIPFSPALEKLVVPNENTILAAVEKLL